MLRSSIFAVLSMLVFTPMGLQAQPIADAAMAQAALVAKSIDTNNDQRISPAELSMFGATVFVLVDTDENDEISRSEQGAFQLGMTKIADFRDRRQAYDTARAIVFDIFDRDGDGAISIEEHKNGFRRGHAFADTDGDGLLSMDEYLRNFFFNIAMRNAMSEP